MGQFFIRRPIVAMVISIVFVLVGGAAMLGLPVNQYPDITPPLIKVTTTFQGASGIDVEQAVATPIEQQVNGAEKMIYMRSTNANDGSLLLQVSFEVGSNIDLDNIFVQNRVSQAQAQLPAEVKQEGVVVKKALPFPLLLVALESPKGEYNYPFLTNYAVIKVNDQLARLPGVGDVALFGASNYAMRVWLRPDRLQSLGLSVQDVIGAVKQQNLIQAGGQIGGEPAPKGTQFTYTIRTPGRLLSAEEFGAIVVQARPDGSVLRLSDVARIELGTQSYTQRGRVNGKPAAVIGVYQMPGSNALAVAKGITDKMNELKKDFPQGLDYRITLDTTAAISAGIDEIIHTLFEALALVIIVVFLFLQSWRATLIPLLTVPVSLIGAFLAFPALGFSVNVLSLLGLVLAIGLVVDDAIVVVEAVYENLEHGMAPKEATAKAMKEVSGPVIAIALVLSAVFVPVAFLGGLTGKLYQQFAVTIAISVLISAFNALSLSPALSSLLLKPPSKDKKKNLLQRFFAKFNQAFDWTRDKYLDLVRPLAKHPIIAVGLTLATMAGIVLLSKPLPVGFLPDEDNGYFSMNIKMPDAAALDRTDAVSARVQKILAETQGVQDVTEVSGYSLLSQSSSPSSGTVFISLKPWGERSGQGQTAQEMVRALNRKLAAAIPEARVLVFGPPAIPGLGSASGFTMQLQDREGKTPEYLAQQVEKFIAAARKRPEIGNISTTFRASVPQFKAVVNRDQASTLGVPEQDVLQTMGALLGGAYVNDFNRFGRTFRVYLQAEPEFRGSPDALGSFFVRTKAGTMVPLTTLVSLEPSAGPDFTNRFNLFRAAELNGTPAEGRSSGEAIAALQDVARQVLPPGMGYEWANVSYQETHAGTSAFVILALGMLLVFLILAAQYESWSLPVSVLLGTPVALLGAFLGLVLARLGSKSFENNVFAQIGLLMLVGLAAKNAILIVEFAKMAHDRGLSPFDAAMEAAKLRLRPILMTAFAFILGVVPLVLARGAGAESRKVMGVAVFAGMIVGTIAGVILVPALYVWVAAAVVKRKEKKERRAGAAQRPALAAPARDP
jgi:HAE1 family hydrophobic/amphiphilic exporter-1